MLKYRSGHESLAYRSSNEQLLSNFYLKYQPLVFWAMAKQRYINFNAPTMMLFIESKIYCVPWIKSTTNQKGLYFKLL